MAKANRQRSKGKRKIEKAAERVRVVIRSRLNATRPSDPPASIAKEIAHQAKDMVDLFDDD